MSTAPQQKPTTQLTPETESEAETKAPQAWFVYLVQTGKGVLYTGISTDPARRLRQHSGELTGGAKALRGKGPLTLVWQQQAPNRSEASRLEYQLKQLKKADKERLIAGAVLSELLPQPEPTAL
ncbi:GIY-YIG nuclease family protein [Rheinheimera sp. 4Y26]|uniref:GIY-YIG nuclease family protein n=1 Tax=Rheinheimera sp. 4Y26 TaxID=2977811 RepID=UPI0028BE0A7B|nr:GIY-YIG nuclease family protein [Rheinheimera sp. 4Y26]